MADIKWLTRNDSWAWGSWEFYKTIVPYDTADTLVWQEGYEIFSSGAQVKNPGAFPVEWVHEPASPTEQWVGGAAGLSAFDCIGNAETTSAVGGTMQGAVQQALMVHYWYRVFETVWRPRMRTLLGRLFDLVDAFSALEWQTGQYTVDDVLRNLGEYAEGDLRTYLDEALNVRLAGGGRQLLGTFLSRALVLSGGSITNLLAHLYVVNDDGEKMMLRDALEGAVYRDPETGEKRHAFRRLMGIPQANLPKVK